MDGAHVFKVSQAVMDSLCSQADQDWNPSEAFTGTCPSCGGSDLTIAAMLRGRVVGEHMARYEMSVSCTCGMVAATDPPTFLRNL